MSRLMQRLVPAAGLLVAVLATVVAVRAWRGELALAEGRAAQRRGDLNAAAAAYRVASGRGNADAAVERSRLEMLRRDWSAANGSLREAMALAPARAWPHVLQAQLEMEIPGPWDDARDERILGSCRIAVALEPYRSRTRRECAAITHRLAARRRTIWNPARTQAVLATAEREVRTVVEKNVKDTKAWFLLGEILRDSGRDGEAAAAFRAAGRKP